MVMAQSVLGTSLPPGMIAPQCDADASDIRVVVPVLASSANHWEWTPGLTVLSLTKTGETVGCGQANARTICDLTLRIVCLLH